ncbi:hypothetical protein EHM92_00190 [bacterium]|nr:MAG: hypothetical protein EHM92_00190 [bacterium]
MSVRKLPLWKSLVEDLITEGVEHGKVYDAARFEEALSCKRGTREFGLAVHEIKMELERHGFYLQGHAIREGSLTIIPPEKHISIAKASERRNQKNRRRAIALLGATDRELLPKKIKPFHEKILMRLQIKQLIEHRAGRIHGYLQKKAPKLLEIRA